MQCIYNTVVCAPGNHLQIIDIQNAGGQRTTSGNFESHSAHGPALASKSPRCQRTWSPCVVFFICLLNSSGIAGPHQIPSIVRNALRIGSINLGIHGGIYGGIHRRTAPLVSIASPSQRLPLWDLGTTNALTQMATPRSRLKTPSPSQRRKLWNDMVLWSPR